MHFTREQRDAWVAETRDSPFNRWLRDRTCNASGSLDIERLRAVAAEYNIDTARYDHLNPGQQRMNIGNRLRKCVPPDVYGDPLNTDTASINSISSSPLPRREPIQPRSSGSEALDDLGTLALLRLQAYAIEVLRERGVVRTANAPLGDYAETLFARAFGWKLAGNSSTAFDAEADDGRRFQIKARRVRHNNPGERELSAIRNLPARGFDFLAAALFNSSFMVMKAAIIPHAIVSARARHIRHVNGWRFILNDEVWNMKGVEDVTEALRNASDKQ